MHVLMLVLNGFTTSQPAILDRTDGECTAPGYRIVEDTVIEPLDHGEPVSRGGDFNVPAASNDCQAFFIPTEDGKK